MPFGRVWNFTAASAVLAVIALLAGGCSGRTEGTAVKSEAAAPTATIDLSQLDVGPYPTKPSPPLGVVGDPARAVLIEAQRMANNVVGPWEVDPAMTTVFGPGAVVVQNAAALTLLGPEGVAGAAGRHQLINGFASARTAEGKTALLNAVLRFPDEASAAAATADMGNASMQAVGPGGQKVPIPGHPDATAASYPVTSRAGGPDLTAVRSFTQHGPYVLMQLAQSADGRDAAAALAAKTIDLQGPAIDQFRATDPSEFADISLDPTGLLARTLPVDPKDAATVQDTTYERRGALHYQSDPTRSAKLFADTGMDLVAMAKANVYQTKDSQSAGKIVDGFFAELSPTSQPAKGVNHLDGSKCLQLEDKSFYCLAAADRYAIEISGANLLEAQQQTAAQYAMLMGG